MIKFIMIIITFFMLLTGMTECSGPFGPEQTTTQSADVTNPDESKVVCEVINDLSKHKYSNIEITIVTTTDFAELRSNYTLTNSYVIYSVEQLNSLPSNGNINDLSSSYKNTITGYALIKDGKVVEMDGSVDITLPSYSELKGSFNFNANNFKNVVIETNSFEADVITPAQFYGADVDMSNLKVKVEYTETSLTKITISYSTTNASVQTVYVFGN